MMLNYLLLLASIIVTRFALIYGYNEPRILSSVITPPNLFQFVVGIGGGTGTIISKRHILTCGHCVHNNKTFIKHGRYQEGVITYKPRFRKGVEKINYKMAADAKGTAYVPITYKYNSAIFKNDIAIVEFPEGTDFGIEPVKLARDYIETPGDETYIAGFGAWWKNGTKTSGVSKVLRHTKAYVYKKKYGSYLLVAGNWTHRALPGDSGGPMLINRMNQWYQIGVSAETSKNGDYRTRVPSFCNFIEEVTKNEVKCESVFPENYYNGQLLPLKHFEPIYQGQSTPLKIFDFVVPLYNYYYKQGCTATIISKRHLLTSAWCVYRDGSTKVTEHSSYKTITGKLFPDLRSKNVQSPLKDPRDVVAYFSSNYKWPWDHNLAVVEFPEGTDFGIEPVTLPKDCIRIFFDQFIIAGYGRYGFKSDIQADGLPPTLQHSNVTFNGDSYEDKHVFLENNENLMKDEGGPTLMDRNGKFYQISVNYRMGTPNGSRTGVSKDCDFIEEVTNNEVQCELVLPIFEKPLSELTTTILPRNPVEPSEAPFMEESSNDNPILWFLKKIFLFWLNY